MICGGWLAAAGAGSAHAAVNLELRLIAPATPVAGDTLRIGLFAVSDDETDQQFAGIDAILNWDQSALRLLGKIDDGPFDWATSWFPDDRNLDRLNADCGPDTYCVPFTRMPFNDGNALYQAFVINLNPPPMATPDGLLVTTFQFRAIGPACVTTVSLAAAAGDDTHSRVVDSGPKGQFDVTGMLMGLSTELPGCRTGGDFNNDCRMTLADYRDFPSCFGGPGLTLGLLCRPADSDADVDADLRDFAAIQRWLECP